MKDKLKVKAYNALYYKTHKESEKQRTYSWRKQNSLRYIAYMKEWHKDNPDNWVKKHPSYTNWKAMMNRCYNPKNKRYKNYGGKRIGVCSAWHKFKIYERDFGYLKPKFGYTVDRINNKAGYCLDNVQWLTNRQNAIKGSR